MQLVKAVELVSCKVTGFSTIDTCLVKILAEGCTIWMLSSWSFFHACCRLYPLKNVLVKCRQGQLWHRLTGSQTIHLISPFFLVCLNICVLLYYVFLLTLDLYVCFTATVHFMNVLY